MKIIDNTRANILLLAITAAIIFLTFKFLEKPKNDIVDNTNLKIIIYTKDGCVYCDKAKAFLDEASITYEAIELANNKELQVKLINQTGQITVPYIFVNDKFIGGYKNLVELKIQNEL